jgi:hypothetical protein
MKYGSIPIVLAGDFTQLKPVEANPLNLFTDFAHWYDWVHTFLIELKPNHQSHSYKPWGEILARFRAA